ncbi:trypsin-like serine protease [Acetobacter musti]|uniref:Trypsin-like serine protease n=2 Tax=Acetobacter musti TaxID=864732 RepID=A0ABX0JLN0_9PROT|nr:trypsin-like serine protease [Acetobacter musti]
MVCSAKATSGIKLFPSQCQTAKIGIKILWWAAAISGLFVAMSAPIAHAQLVPVPARPGIGTGDTRRQVGVEDLPWSAIGRVQTELGGRCTGFLIAPAVVETAAHCLWIAKTGHYIQPRDVHFLRAYNRGQFASHARVARFLIPPGYDPRREALTAAYDRATLFLDAPAGTPTQSLTVAQNLPAPGDGVMLGGYEQDFREVVTSDMACHVMAIVADGNGQPMISHNCDATRGSSGAPLLVYRNGNWIVTGVQVLANFGRGGAAAPLMPVTSEKTQDDRR